MTRTRVNMTIRPDDLTLLDAMADAQGLTRGQMVESLVRLQTRRVCDAGPEKGWELYRAVRGALSRIADDHRLGQLIGVGTGPDAGEHARNAAEHALPPRRAELAMKRAEEANARIWEEGTDA